MANTYTLIASYAATGSVSNIEFTTIPATYTDLLVKVSSRSADSGTGINITFNSDAGANYKWRRLYGDGSSATSNNSTSANYISSNFMNQYTYTANTFGNGDIYITNYASSNTKTVSIDGVTENNATGSFAILSTGSWTTTAITSIKLESDGGTIAQYSTAYLYGIKNS